MFRKLTVFAVVLFTFALTSVALATQNGWTGQRTISNVLLLDTDLGEVCQFQLSDQSIWAFTVSGREKLVDLVQSAMTSTKLINVNYGRPSTGGGAVDDFLTYTPLNGATQRNGRAYGIVVPR